MTKKKTQITEDSPYPDKVDIINSDSRKLSLGVEGLFTDKEEIKLAKELEKKYLNEYNIETVSDKNLLYYLIYLEVLHTAKLQKTANQFTASNDDLPYGLLDSIHKNINQIIEIKEKLGLTRKEEVSNDAFKSLELLKKKFKIWAENNQASRTLICPHCSKMILLKIRTTAWEAQKHPFFKDRLLGNESLIRLYKEGRLNKEEIASILGTSADYADWLINKWSVDINTPSKETEVKQESSVVPLTVDSTVDATIETKTVVLTENVLPLNGNSEIDTVTK